MRLRPAVISLVVACSLLMSGCVPVAPSEPGASGESLRPLLESAGIVVASSPDDLAVFGSAAVVLLPEQVASMAAQQAAGTGVSGTDLDSMVAIDSGLPPMAFILAGWAKDWDGNGAKAVRELLGPDVDWNFPERILWSDAALALLLADVTADLELAEFAPTASGPSIQLASAVLPNEINIGALCQAGASFIDNALAAVFAAIEYASKKAQDLVGGGFLGQIVALGFSLFTKVVQGVVTAVKEITAAILAPVKDALIVVAILQNVSSLLKPWAVTMTGDPTKVIAGQSEVFGSVRAGIKSAGPLPPFPNWVKDCAKSVGIELPEPPGKGAKVDWDFDIGSDIWGKFLDADGIVQKDDSASMRYVVNAERPETWDGDPVEGFLIEVSVRPNRDEIARLNAFADKFISGELAKVPAAIRDLVSSTVASLRAEVVAQLTTFLTPGVKSKLQIPMTRHAPKDEEMTTKRLPDPASYTFCVAYADYGEWTVAHWGEILGAISGAPISENLNAALSAARAIYQPQEDLLMVMAPPQVLPILSPLMRYSSDKPILGLEEFAINSEAAMPNTVAIAAWTKIHCDDVQLSRMQASYEYFGSGEYFPS